MWNNYTVEMQTPGRIEDRLAEARANTLEGEVRGPHTSLVVIITRRTGAALALRASRMYRSAAGQAGVARLVATARIRATRHRLAVAAGHLRHLHPHRPAFSHRA